VRVHEEILKRQKLPSSLVGKRIWDERLVDIVHVEDYFTRQGTIILKFFLHVSRKEQKKRFMERLDRPEKHWKFSASDVHERNFWANCMHAFEQPSGRRRRNMRRGTWSRPTTSGSPGLSSPQRSSRLWRNSTSNARRWVQRKRGRWRQRVRSLPARPQKTDWRDRGILARAVAERSSATRLLLERRRTASVRTLSRDRAALAALPLRPCYIQ